MDGFGVVQDDIHDDVFIYVVNHAPLVLHPATVILCSGNSTVIVDRNNGNGIGVKGK